MMLKKDIKGIATNLKALCAGGDRSLFLDDTRGLIISGYSFMKISNNEDYLKVKLEIESRNYFILKEAEHNHIKVVYEMIAELNDKKVMYDYHKTDKNHFTIGDLFCLNLKGLINQVEMCIYRKYENIQTCVHRVEFKNFEYYIMPKTYRS